MIFPEPATSIASALTIIDYAVKLFHFLSPSTQQALKEAQGQLSQGYKSSKEADEILIKALRMHLPAGEVQAMSEDIRFALEVMQPMVEEIERSQKYKQFPRYGLAISTVVEKTYKKLDSWRCFTAWGQEMYGQDEFALPMSYTEKGIRQCRSIINQVDSLASRGNLYITRRLNVDAKVDWESCYLWFTDRTRMVVARTYTSGLAFDDGSIVIMNKVNIGKSDVEGKSASVAITRLTYQDLAYVVGGLLGDVVYYSRLIRGEIDASQFIVEKLKDIFK